MKELGGLDSCFSALGMDKTNLKQFIFFMFLNYSRLSKKILNDLKGK